MSVSLRGALCELRCCRPNSPVLRAFQTKLRFASAKQPLFLLKLGSNLELIWCGAFAGLVGVAAGPQFLDRFVRDTRYVLSDSQRSAPAMNDAIHGADWDSHIAGYCRLG